ncbi:(1-_4)-alpha-D-glucan 1-alpha-D-glucosylmutase [Rhizobium sp. BK529]|uniref:malto-oligosyltrehalose synthase n=1 Tax=unclassified Rhizobium TaxID=2613769 RepID=UPI00104590A8|nr:MULTISPECIES: malto-oligosyltrehalose synthase [unclassified Rhizobium]MBB3593830.1 (1->4)-alpha-D-glucan 1-alpha-D-glucosylmutase [Rhizobium sp. BK529]TCS01287.1 maltooligosyl trehalose synthase [Rhizobium sp. BK418]
MTLPSATYRIQFRNGMTFDSACELVPYLKSLGISHLYASPIFSATTGSTHGYDMTDANEIDPVLGGRAGFDRLTAALSKVGMEVILDIVPNHMAASLENAWWRSVLEFGRQSPFADHFDIDWSERLTLPQLGKSFDECLTEDELTIVVDEARGNLAIAYYDTLLPLSRRSYAMLVQKLDDPILTGMTELAGSSDGDALHRGLRDLIFEAGDFARLKEGLAVLSQDQQFMRELHKAQHWQLQPWQEASRHLSYRRFFEVTGLVGLRVEDPKVFEASHRLVLELVRQGQVQGLRLDHIDGLAEPTAYLQRLRQAVGTDTYIVVEKILGAGEELPTSWPVEGTTGYEFIATLSELFVESGGLQTLNTAYRRLAAGNGDFEEGRRAAKTLMVERNFAGETGRLTQIAHGIFPELAEETIAQAIRELLIAFPVYRTYGADGPLDARDAAFLQTAVASAGGHVHDSETLERIAAILEGPVDDNSAREFRMRFQQLSGPIMAKAMEDTLFYRYNRLLAMNEVGGEPDHAPGGVDAFHLMMKDRQQSQPFGVSTTSTHDTKRGEDARARLYILSEGADVFANAIEHWCRLNASHRKELPDGAAPEPNIEWMLYQALAGAWPKDFDRRHADGLRERFSDYVEKAIREAKLRTDWTASNSDYEEAVRSYAAALLSPENDAFLEDFARVMQPFIEAGYINSLSQTLIKLTAPGIPDIYQGAEGFDFSFVDPDNRRPPDFDRLANWLAEGAPIARLQAEALKQRVIQIGLKLRLQHEALFTRGEYLPLLVNGTRRDHVVAFARLLDDDFAITVVPRLMFGWLDPGVLFAGPEFWEDTAISVPSPLHRLKADLLTGKMLEPGSEISLAALLGDQPAALIGPA